MGDEKKYALIFDADISETESLEKLLQAQGVSVVRAQNLQEARGRLNFQKFDLVFVDLDLPKEWPIPFLTLYRESMVSKSQLGSVGVFSCKELDDSLVSKLSNLFGVGFISKKPLVAEDIISFVNERLHGISPVKAYDVRIINAFLLATISTIESNTQISPVKGVPFVKKFAMTLGEFSGVIQFVGKTLKGSVAISFERPCLEQVAGVIFRESKMELSNELLLDFAGEMCNQIAGAAQVKFEALGSRFEITPPTLISGSNVRIVHKISAPCLVLPFTWNGARFFTEFVLEGSFDESEVTDGKTEKTPVADSGDVTFF